MKDRGGALLGAISLLGCLSLITYLFMDRYVSLIRLTGDTIQLENSDEIIAANVLSGIEGSLPIRTIQCPTFSGKIGRSLTDSTTCFIRGDPTPAVKSELYLSPEKLIIDYDNIFSAPDLCNGSGVTTGEITESPNRVNGPIGSSLTCKIIDQYFAGLLSVPGNLALPTLLTITAGKHPNLLGAAGRIESTGELIIQSDTIILAGGDISLRSVITPVGSPIRITIISITGIITVGDTSGPGEYLLYTHKKAKIPSTLKAQHIPLYPPLLRAELVGKNSI